MVVEKLPMVILPSGRVREEFSWCSRSWKRRRRRNIDEIAKKSFRPEGFEGRSKYMPKGAPDGARGAQAPPPPSAAQGGRAARAPGALVPPPPPAVLRAQGRFWNADFLYNFSGFFLAVLVT